MVLDLFILGRRRVAPEPETVLAKETRPSKTKYSIAPFGEFLANHTFRRVLLGAHPVFEATVASGPPFPVQTNDS